MKRSTVPDTEPVLWDPDTAAYMELMSAEHAACAASISLPVETATRLVPLAKLGTARASTLGLGRYESDWSATTREFSRKVEAFVSISKVADIPVPLTLARALLPIVHAGLARRP